MENQIRIALVDDHLLVRNGIKSLLEEEQDIQVIAEGSNGYEAIDIVNNLHPDLLIIDVRMPEMSGIEAVGKLQGLSSNTKAIVLSMHDSEEYILKSIKAGASGYLLKDTDKKEFIKAIRTVNDGGKYFSGDISNVIVDNYLQKTTSTKKSESLIYETDPFGLTKKEKQILSLILSGKTNSEISEILSNSKRTIETHRFNMMKKMNVKNLMELSSKAVEYGLN
ncbi:response regulator transcription factor [Urechidicola croceus]|uniref:DNA-binding response regulator n=1 Tax=Urechidicola croceus TaxID=1850246 RepID=A0A1D8P711_9FLAO|nr:response regulator transcription factor [Urechidicola croceus]AOW20352.1 DNA-binding response regulator [Urechidicola croceus]